ncbi:MAG: hypothetical protein JXA52_06525, partial [Planctomycetes bacterium]|nr:hypothetical protein [Planctomycetota bacterium]
MRSGLSAALILSAAFLLSGFDWKEGISTPFRKTKNAIVTTGKKVAGNDIDPASANLDEDNTKYDFVIEIGGQRRAEGHREY